MKKVMACLFCLALTASLLPLSASGEMTRTAAEADGAAEGVTIGEEVTLGRGQWLLFKDLPFGGVRSVKIGGSVKYDTSADGDVWELRLDDPSGELLAYLPMTDGMAESFGVNVNASGRHDLYVASLYSNNAAIRTLTLSQEAVGEALYVPKSSRADVIDLHTENWTMTDGLGRRMADYEEVGEIDPAKQVGIFYHTSHSAWPNNEQVVNNSKWYREHPEIFQPDQYYNELWPTGNVIHFWDEPLFGYYSGEDYWVYRKHAELLGSAGIDFLYFDCTNGIRYFHKNMSVLCRALSDAEANGTPSPQIVICSNLSYPVENTWTQLKHIYLAFYKPGLYKETWYTLGGKPLIMAHIESIDAFVDKNDPADVALAEEIKNFFTFRGHYTDAKHKTTVPEGKWEVLDSTYPKRAISSQAANGRPEAVGINFESLDHYILNVKVAASNPMVYTKADTIFYGKDYREGMYRYDLFAEEQFAGALDIDANLLLVASWNEFEVGRFREFQGVSGDKTNTFIDLFKDSVTRDCEITKGENKDYSYCLLCDFVRRWKGMNKPESASAPQTIDLTGGLDAWEAVAPSFINNRGTYQRNAQGYEQKIYTNDTARNNVILSKVTRDDENVYFMAKTSAPLTSDTDEKWMRLYINIDRNRATGWEGFDFRINGEKAGSLEAWQDSRWSAIGTVSYAVYDAGLALSVPRRALGAGDALDFEFKWVDNADDADILNFYVDGNAAPLGRFNYRYTEREQRSLPQEARQALASTTIVKAGSNRAIVGGAKLFVYEPDLRYGTRMIDGVVYFPAPLLKDVLGFGVSQIVTEPDRQFIRMRNHDILVYTYFGENYAYANGAYKTLSHPVITVDGLPYIPVTLMAEAFGWQGYDAGGGVWAFGASVDRAAVDSAAAEI